MPLSFPFAQARDRPNAPRWQAARNFPANRGALVLCALFLAVGVAVVDDYGASLDEKDQRLLAVNVADYVARWARDREALEQGYTDGVANTSASPLSCRCCSSNALWGSPTAAAST